MAEWMLRVGLKSALRLNDPALTAFMTAGFLAVS